MAREPSEDLIRAYKSRLSTLLDQRPSGTRQRLADALGKHRSFVTQISSPAYATPIPARHLPTIFSVCHFSAVERRQFLEDYHRAHPQRQQPRENGKAALRHLTLTVHDLGEREKNRLFDEAIADFAHRMGALLAGKKE
jgi:hypothetical protein